MLKLSVWLFLTVVLDDAFKVVRHKIPQGTLVGQPESVGKHDGCVYNRIVDQLLARARGTEVSRVFGLSPLTDLCAFLAHLQGEKVALQTVTNEDGLSAEETEQHGLDVS